jgi:hypothetical protein
MEEIARWGLLHEEIAQGRGSHEGGDRTIGVIAEEIAHGDRTIYFPCARTGIFRVGPDNHQQSYL